MKLNIKYTIGSASIAILALAACNNENMPENEAGQSTEIRLTSGIEVMSRAYTPKQDEQIAKGEKVYIWADEVVGSEEVTYFHAWELTADGNGSFESVADADKKYFPESGNGIDLYAIHGNSPEIETDMIDFPISGITHNIETNQTVDGNFKKSDLLYASHQDIERTKSAIPVKFYHMLSKIQIAIRPGAGLTLSDLDGSTVSVLNTKTQVGFTPSKVADLSDAAVRSSMVSASGVENEISVPAVSVDYVEGAFTSADNYGEAIIAPQTLAAGTQFIKVTLEGRNPLYYVLNAEEKFESGKRYIYHITVNLTELDVESSIEGWGTGTTNNGEATMD
ncbi:fimbrillin family protein [Phocaeicola plebeius]|uniref:fimbrillin family protein n=1 Tax=Phocaeicola plebeius TaxID=310297 RepID=UPI0026F36288|nr:fimbrillin family protein [Phocaeicola plebeius]